MCGVHRAWIYVFWTLIFHIRHLKRHHWTRSLDIHAHQLPQWGCVKMSNPTFPQCARHPVFRRTNSISHEAFERVGRSHLHHSLPKHSVGRVSPQEAQYTDRPYLCDHTAASFRLPAPCLLFYHTDNIAKLNIKMFIISEPMSFFSVLKDLTPVISSKTSRASCWSVSCKHLKTGSASLWMLQNF